jgi:hypothetical protein
VRLSFREYVTAHVEVSTSCRRCHHRDVAQLVARGSGVHEFTKWSVFASYRRSKQESALEEAEIDAHYNGLLLSKIARCPACSRRDPLWTAWLVFVASWWGVAVAAIPFAIGAVAHAWPWWVGGLVWAVLPFTAGTAWKTKDNLAEADAVVTFGSVG